MSDRSIIKLFATGLRVGSKPEYVPAHSKLDNGVRVNVSARLTVSAYHNIPGKANNGKGKSESMSYTFWGGLADIAAKTLAKGKEFNVLAVPNVYDGAVYQPAADGKGSNGVPGQWANGQRITTKKVSFTVEEFTLGRDSGKTVEEEIGAKIRPADWNKAGSPGHATWGSMQAERMKVKFQHGFTEYGYAVVKAPTGQEIGPYQEGLSRAGSTPTGTAAVVGQALAQQSAANAFPAAPAPMGTIPAVGAPNQIQLVKSTGGF